MKSKILLISLILLLPFLGLGQTESKKTIYFASNSAALDQKSIQSVDSLASIYGNATNYTMHVSGHTDDIGSPEFNMALSGKRIAAVLNQLAGRIPAGNIKTGSFGEAKPALENNSDNNRAKNRRVEIRLQTITPPVTDIVPEEEKSVAGWPPEDGILVGPGTNDYKIPGTSGDMVRISLITNTAEMEAENISTLTTTGEPLASNIMICIRGPVGNTPCNLAKPLRIYIPAGGNPLCRPQNVKFYDAQKDSIGSGMIKWKEILPAFGMEEYKGDTFFVAIITSLCNNPCKNFDCPKFKYGKAKIKLKARKYKIIQADMIYEKANALLPGWEISRNNWTIIYFDFKEAGIPILKLVTVKKKKQTTKRFILSQLEKDAEGNYIILKKQIRDK